MTEISPGTILLVACLVIGGAYMLYPANFTAFFEGSYETDTTGTTTGTEVILEEGIPTQIIAISNVLYQVSCIDGLNESYEPLTRPYIPTFYLWREGASEPVTVQIVNGTGLGNQTCAPGETITVSAGNNSEIYWDKIYDFKVGTANTAHEIKFMTVAHAGEGTIQMFDGSYNLQGFPNNVTVGAGQTVSLQAQIDTTGEYTAVRRPHICVDYNTTITRDVRVSGLTEVDSPTRLIASLDQCFYTGIDYLTDSDPKLLYDISVSITSGQEPFATNTTILGMETNSQMVWYVIDQDLWFQDGEFYFINPLTNADMGQSNPWNTTTWFA